METNNQNNIDLIEQFIDGNLSKEEQHNFNVRLKSDDAFARLYRFRIKIREDLQMAKQYEKAGKLVAGTIKRYERKKRLNTIYAIAAGLALLIAIPGIFTIVNNNELNNLAETDSTNIEVFEPQINTPESYADSGEYTPGETEMNTHVKTDSVVFNWQPETVLPSVLALNRLADGVEIYTVAIEPGTNSFAIQKSKIGSGKFTWHLQGFVLKDTFEIANIK